MNGANEFRKLGQDSAADMGFGRCRRCHKEHVAISEINHTAQYSSQ